MNEKKTGIFTLCAAQNYGAVLQCYALCRFINDNYTPSEIIDFTPEFIIHRYPIFIFDKTSINSLIRSIVSNLFNGPIRCVKYWKFNSFRKNSGYYGKKRFIGQFNDDSYSYYIVGSDQVYNLKLTKYDKEYFLPRIDGNKKATYAASLGVSQLSDEDERILEEGLKDFKQISIRETTGCSLIQHILRNRDVEQMIDPVFLIKKGDWSSMCAKNLVFRKYILIYSFKSFENAYKIAKRISGELLIVSIDDALKKKRADVKNMRGVGPKEFLSLIYHAEYVITDSFHGTAFSIIFNKKFYSIPYEGTESRVVDMLDLFGLRDRIVLDASMIDFKDINYISVNSEIEHRVDLSKGYFERFFRGVSK